MPASGRDRVKCERKEGASIQANGVQYSTTLQYNSTDEKWSVDTHEADNIKYNRFQMKDPRNA